MTAARSSRQRYQEFIQDYKKGRLDDSAGGSAPKPESSAPAPARGKRREYLRGYIRWLRPHRYAVATLFLLALTVAGLQMIEPLFMRFIVDRVLLNA
jgi:ATP-binding cassette, subfamily B, bacterial